MSKTVNEFAQELKVPVKTLLDQLRAAGVHKTNETDELSDEDRMTVMRARKLQRFLARPGLHDFVAGALEVDDHKAPDADLVFQNHYFLHSITLLTSLPNSSQYE